LSKASCIFVKFPGPFPPTYNGCDVISSAFPGRRIKEKKQSKIRITTTSIVIFFIASFA
jgi:hypothetical protein